MYGAWFLKGENFFCLSHSWRSTMPVSRPEPGSVSAGFAQLDPFATGSPTPWLPGDRDQFQRVIPVVRNRPRGLRLILHGLLLLGSIGLYMFWLPGFCARVQDRAQHFTRIAKRPVVDSRPLDA